MPTKREGHNMPKKRPKGDEPRRQFNIAFAPEIAKRIEDTADTLGLDATSFLRMLVRKHLHEYEAQAAEIKKHDNRK